MLSTHSELQPNPAVAGLRSLLGRHKTHHYDHLQQGIDFVLERDLERTHLYTMTAQKAGVHMGDHIDIAGPEGHQHFKVQEIEYYDDPAEMWMAQLQPLAE